MYPRPTSERRRARWLAPLAVLAIAMLVGAVWLFASDSAKDWLLRRGEFDRARLEVAADPSPEPSPAGLRAFYSGHSLSDGVPEEVARIAASKGRRFEFDVESLPGSLIRERLQRRTGSTARAEAGHDVQVVTERHDLPYAARFEGTARELRRQHDELRSKNPRATTYFYHTWLEIDVDDPAAFVRYEREALPLWECVASAANQGLAPAERILVLPGGSALAELVERLMQGELPAVTAPAARQRVALLFEDLVHPSPLARYFMGAVHYAALFAESPVGATAPPGVEPELAQALAALAWEHISAYALRAGGAAARDMALCREYAGDVMCPAFAAHPRGDSPENALVLWRRKRQCQSWFGDPNDPGNPFRNRTSAGG